MKKKENRILILSLLGTLLLLSIAVAGSYAYFVANVSGNKDTNNVVVTWVWATFLPPSLLVRV